MKLAVFLVLSCFIASTFTTHTADVIRKIAKEKFGKTLLDTIQLELESNSKADPRPRILQLLQDIKDEALESLQTLNDQHKTAQDACDKHQSDLQDAIDQLNSQNDAATSEISAKQTELQAVTSERDAKQSIVDTLTPYLQQITDQRNQAHDAFEDEDTRQGQIIAVLEKTRQFISDRLDARQSEVSGTFLEKSNVLVQVKETVMGPEFQRLSPGWGQLINFLATKALNKFKQEEDDDAQATAGLQSIVDLINQILADTNVARNNAQATENAAQAAFDDESGDLNNKLSLAKTDISADDAHIGVLNDRINELKGAISANNDLISDKKAELNDSKTSCDSENDSYQQSFATRNGELQLIDEVIAIVQNDLTGLKQSVEDVINNGDYDLGDDSS